MIYEIIKYKTVNGVQHETCITDGKNLQNVVERAEKYLEEEYGQEGLFGYHEDTYTLRVWDDEIANEFERDIVLKVQVEKDTTSDDSRHWRDLGRYI